MTTTNWRSCLALLFAGTLALTGCSSSSNGKDGAPGKDGTPGQDGSGSNTPPGVTTGLNVAVTGVSQDASGIQVRFTLTDDKGFPIDIAGKYSVNTPIWPKFSLSYLSKDDKGQELPLTVLTASGKIANPTATSPTAYDTSGKNYRGAATAPQGTLVENGSGNGDYTYTFPAADISSTGDGALYKGVTYDASKLSSTHVVWIEVTRQTDVENPSNPLTFTAKNEPYYYVPATGAVSDERREVASTANCSNCHAGFKPEGKVSSAFHGGSRVDAAYCVVCHNPARTSNPAANAMVFVHRIHAAEELQSANIFDGIADVTYPQDLRNCAACHAGAAQGDQWKTRPSRAACGSCHDKVDFANTGTDSAVFHPEAQTDDTHCAECHTPDGIAGSHLAVVPPDPNNYLHPVTSGQATSGKQGSTTCSASAPCTCTVDAPCTGVGNANTNAAYVAAAKAVPPGAVVISYDVKSVSRNDSKQPVIVFKLQKTVDGVTSNVTFPTCLAVPAYTSSGTKNANQELMDGFIGSPSVYFVWAMPQDGVQKPADFNASASGYIKDICNGNAFFQDKTNLVNVPTATIAGPDTDGYYTITLIGTPSAPTIVADEATMLTGGVGYTYALTSTQPLTQINLDAYPYNTTTKEGGLLVPAADVYKVATGFTGRRAIVDNARCNTCHAFLGVAPTFHAGQRNDGPSCSWCHTANRTSGGWSANSKDIIHGIHAGRIRSVPFTWHAPSADDNYGDVTFPSRLNNCEACHAPGTYDFTANAAALPNMLWSTAAAYATSDAASYVKPPYVTASLTTLGAVFSTSNVTKAVTSGTVSADATVVGGGVQGSTKCSSSAPCTCTTDKPCTVTMALCTLAAPCQAESTSLVTSPITAACIACHDADDARAHMKWGGGTFYATRDAAQTADPEQCLLCHGHGKIADISQVHMGK